MGSHHHAGQWFGRRATCLAPPKGRSTFVRPVAAKDFPLEHFVRGAKVTQTYGDTNKIQQGRSRESVGGCLPDGSTDQPEQVGDDTLDSPDRRCDMGMKQSLHPLATSDVVTDDQAAALREYSITSLEELLGALRARRQGVAAVLGPDVDVADLQERVSEALPAEVAQRYSGAEPIPKRGFGARIEPAKGD